MVTQVTGFTLGRNGSKDLLGHGHILLIWNGKCWIWFNCKKIRHYLTNTVGWFRLSIRYPNRIIECHFECLPITRPPQQKLFYIVLGCWMGCGNIPFEGGSSCFGTSGPTVFFSLQPNRLPWSQKKSLHFLYLFFIFHFSFQRFFIICISNNNIIGEKVRKCWTFIYLKRIFHTYFVMSIWVYSEIRKMSSLCIFVMLDYHKSYL